MSPCSCLWVECRKQELLALLPANNHLAADVVDYVVMSGKDGGRAVKALLAEMQPERVEAIMQVVENEWVARGRTEGRVEMLEEHLRHRFKSIPKGIRARIAGAPAKQVKAWFKAAHDAPSLKAVFGD